MIRSIIYKLPFLLTLLTIPSFLYCSSIQVEFNPVVPANVQISALEVRFENYQIYELDISLMRDTLVSAPGRVGFNLNLVEGFQFPVFLEPAEVITNDYILQISSPGGISSQKSRKRVAFKGEVEGHPGSHVRLTIDENFFYGFIQLGEERWFFEPLRFFVGESANRFVFYNVNDVRDVYHENLCASMDLEVNRDKLIRQMWLKNDGEEELMTQSRAAGNCYVLDIAIASDWLMYTKYGQDVTELENRNIGVMNNVQGNYEGEFDDDIVFNIVTQYISTCSSCDPWTNSTEAGTLLSSFRNWGNGGGFGVSYGVASLWTDRNFNGSTIGVAYLNGICNSWRYNVLQDFSSNANFLRVLKAHELGHNFSSGHDAQGSFFIMAPSVTTSNNWSTQSNNSISNYINNRSNISNCLEDCPDPVPPIADFFIANELICPGSSVYFYDLSENNPNSWEWFFPGGTPSSSTERYPVVSYEFEGTYDVTLLVFNDFGFDEITIVDAIEVSAINGYDMVLYDDFEDGLGNWTIDNPDGNFTWQTTAISHMPIGDNGIGINNFNYSNRGQKDAIISESMDFFGRGEIYLEIEYAHRRRNAIRRDSLNVFVSTNGGQTFPHKVFANAENGSGNFATATDLNAFFTPVNDSDWCVDGSFGSDCIFVDLSAFAGEENVVLRIENVTDNGNNTFINRVMVYSICQVTDPPNPAFLAFPQSGCAELIVEFVDISDNEPNQWLWQFTGGQPSISEEQNPVVTYSEAGWYDVTLEAFNSAGSNTITEQAYIYVNDVPIPEFTYEINMLGVSFTNHTQNALNYFWSFGDGNFSTDFNPTHIYEEGGIYEVSLEAGNECGTEFYSVTIEVVDLPSSNFEPNPGSGCAPLEVEFENLSGINATSFQWLFPGGSPEESTEVNPTITYTDPGSYDVTLIALNSSGTDTLKVFNAVTVLDTPVAEFELTAVEDSLFTSNFSEYGVEYLWDFGNGDSSPLEEPIYIYENDGIYLVTLIVSNLCGGDTTTMEIEIATPPIASMSVDTSFGCLPETIQFFNEASSNADSLTWIFEGGEPEISHEENPLVIYNAPGIFGVTLIAFSSGGTDTLYSDSLITIGQNPVADATVTAEQRAFNFSNSSSDADQYLWDFGDGNSSTEENPMHVYSEDGEFEVVFYAVNRCDTSIWTTVAQAYKLPNAFFIANGDSLQLNGCSPLTVLYSDETEGFVEGRIWQFEGGTPSSSTSRDVEVTYSNPGVYDVLLIAFNPAGSDTVVFNGIVQIPEKPTVVFEFETDDLTVSLNADVRNADGVIWDFGDGRTSNEVNPIISFEEEGLYTISLIAWNQCDTVVYQRDVGLGSFPQSDFSILGESEGCAPLTIQFENRSSTNSEELEWIFEGGDPLNSTDENPTVVFAEPGIYSVTLRVSNSIGSNSLTLQDVIVVSPQPEAEFEYQNPEDGMFEFINLSRFANSYFWDFGEGNSSSEENPIHEFESAGNYWVEMIASNECGLDTTGLEVIYEPVGIKELEDYGFRLFPNPTNGIVLFEFREMPGDIELSLISISGQTLENRLWKDGSGPESIDLSGMPSGQYIIMLKLRGEVFQFPIQLIGAK